MFYVSLCEFCYLTNPSFSLIVLLFHPLIVHPLIVHTLIVHTLIVHTLIVHPLTHSCLAKGRLSFLLESFAHLQSKVLETNPVSIWFLLVHSPYSFKRAWTWLILYFLILNASPLPLIAIWLSFWRNQRIWSTRWLFDKAIFVLQKPLQPFFSRR